MEQEQNRSEAPTNYKLMRARQKGQVARGTDLSFLVVLVASLGTVWIGGRALATGLARAMHDALVSGSLLAGDRETLFAVIGMSAAAIMRPLLSFSLVVFVLVLLMELIQTGFVFSIEPLRFDLSRLNPGQGFKRVFSLRMLAETGRNVLKFALYPIAAWLVLRALLAADAASIRDAASLAEVLRHLAIRLVSFFAGVALLFAVADQLFARRSFLKRMRMSRRELKQEIRDREGEPRLKQKRKQMHGEFVRNSRALKGVRGADLMVVNPQHVAVALRYDARSMAAPVVVASGINRLARRLKRLAFLYNVPVIEDKALARALFRSTTIDHPIPTATFRAVASLYNQLNRTRERTASQ